MTETPFVLDPWWKIKWFSIVNYSLLVYVYARIWKEVVPKWGPKFLNQLTVRNVLSGLQRQHMRSMICIWEARIPWAPVGGIPVLGSSLTSTDRYGLKIGKLLCQQYGKWEKIYRLYFVLLCNKDSSKKGCCLIVQRREKDTTPLTIKSRKKKDEKNRNIMESFNPFLYLHLSFYLRSHQPYLYKHGNLPVSWGNC